MIREINHDLYEYRTSEMFLRNSQVPFGYYDMPEIRTCEIDLKDLKLQGFHNRPRAGVDVSNKTLHFFKEDYTFERVYTRYAYYLPLIKKYKQVLTPDFSMFSDMPRAIQIFNTFRSRWCGAYWQKNGVKVIPTINWSDRESYSFCFDSICEGATVAVASSGSKKFEDSYMEGFSEFCARKKPEHVICYGKPFDGMYKIADIIVVPDEGKTTSRERGLNDPDQQWLDY